MVTVPERDCDALRDLLIAECAETVVEVGLAYGRSALAIGEALWIAWNLKPGLRVTGRTRENASVRIVPLTNSMTDWSLYSADAVQGRGDTGTTDADSFQPIDTEAQLEIDHLVFEVLDEDGATLNRVAIVIGTPSLYAHLTGLAAPAPSTSADAYGGWRLP